MLALCSSYFCWLSLLSPPFYSLFHGFNHQLLFYNINFSKIFASSLCLASSYYSLYYLITSKNPTGTSGFHTFCSLPSPFPDFVLSFSFLHAMIQPPPVPHPSYLKFWHYLGFIFFSISPSFHQMPKPMNSAPVLTTILASTPSSPLLLSSCFYDLFPLST